MSRTDTAVRVISASPDRVFAALTDSDARAWVNPDCGLKTRGWEEVLPALEHMLEATRRRTAARPVVA